MQLLAQSPPWLWRREDSEKDPRLEKVRAEDWGRQGMKVQRVQGGRNFCHGVSSRMICRLAFVRIQVGGPFGRG